MSIAGCRAKVACVQCPCRMEKYHRVVIGEDLPAKVVSISRIVHHREISKLAKIVHPGNISELAKFNACIMYELQENNTMDKVECEKKDVLFMFGVPTQMLFIEAFLQNNRLDNITQVIGFHPHYLDAFLRTQQFLLRGDGPLPYDYRHYIALMAAGRHQCTYLINQLKEEFLKQGGEPRWLEGLQNIPQKLRDIYEINKILAHRPWLLKQVHIEKLTKGKDNWSISEVVHAVVILAHYHSLASFVFGCGINPEIDHENGHTFRPPSPPNDGNVTSTSMTNSSGRSSPQGMDIDCGVETLMNRMKTLSEQSQLEETPYEELVKRFEKVESSTLELTLDIDVVSTPRGDVSRYIQDSQFVYQDFAKRGELTDIPTFRVQDYSWDDHGFSLANRLYNEVGTLLDEKFKKAYNLTYNTMANRNNVDTTMFRRAIWNYIHCMFGIRHDDYDYSEVNQLLERKLKGFIKTVCCYPEKTTKKEYDSVMREFKHSEKVHVNLMILEARLQAELLYALRAVMQYMT
ncbi:Sestrin-1 [Nymphon striatum]|nr:Sestrin-1 [Nymphon striatum]